MSLDECAERMERFLSRKPRSAKTRAYLATLPQPRNRRVTPDQYIDQKTERARQFAEAKAAAMRVLERLQAREGIIPPEPVVVRKARLRPRAKSKWACRSFAHRHREGRRISEYAYRDMDACNAWRHTLHAAQEGICGLCGKPMEGDPERLSLDHVIPRFDGGVDALGNLMLCHKECNGQKSNDIPTGCEMIALIAVNVRLGVKPDRF